MARCEQGYLCDVCGGEVAEMIDSDLYLRDILGEVPLAELHRSAERHIRCNPANAQFIVDPAFPTVALRGRIRQGEPGRRLRSHAGGARDARLASIAGPAGAADTDCGIPVAGRWVRGAAFGIRLSAQPAPRPNPKTEVEAESRRPIAESRAESRKPKRCPPSTPRERTNWRRPSVSSSGTSAPRRSSRG